MARSRARWPHSTTTPGTLGDNRRELPEAPRRALIMRTLPTPFTGQSLKRVEAPRLLRGQATFLDDVRLPSLLHIAFVRSVHPHARFRIDARVASGIP